jgi:hypothetical protein
VCGGLLSVGRTSTEIRHGAAAMATKTEDEGAGPVRATAGVEAR